MRDQKAASGSAKRIGKAQEALAPFGVDHVKRRTWRRWRRLAWGRYSLLRELEYEAIEGLVLRGRTLDVGGGRKNSYHHLLRFEGSVVTVNLDAATVPSATCDLNGGLPFRSETFDNVLSLNTFEHVYRDEWAIAESLRVLRRGGGFHFVVPWLYRVHGSPSDYHRHTANAWRRMVSGYGPDAAAIRIEALVWDAGSTGASLSGDAGGLGRAIRLALGLVEPRYWIRNARSLFPWTRGRPWRRGASPLGPEHYLEWRHAIASQFALGYYICGFK